MNNWHVVRLDRNLGARTQDWDALNQRLFNGHPLLHSDFINALLEHFGDASIHLCTLSDDQGVQAMALLQPRSALAWTTFLPSQMPIGPLLFPGGLDLGALVRALPGWVQSLDLLCVDPAFVTIEQAAPLGVEAMGHALTVRVSLDDDFETYWAARGTGLRQNMRRYIKRLTDDGLQIQHRIASDPADIVAAAGRYSELESIGWKAGLGTAVVTGSAQHKFYQQVLHAFARDGCSQVQELWADDRLVASRLFISRGKTLVALKTTYDESLRKYAMGRVLLHHALESLHASHSGSVLEFYTNANRDQLAWSTGHRTIEHWTVYRSDLTHAAVIAARRFRGGRPPVSNATTEVHQKLTDLPADVRQLLTEAERSNMGFGLAWYETLVQQVFAHDEGVRFHVLRIGGRAQAVVPVLLQRKGRSRRAVALGNFYTCLYSPVIAPGVTAADLEPLLHAIVKGSEPVSSLTFAPMDPRSDAFGLLQTALRRCGLHPFRYFAFGNWYLPCEGLSWETYYSNRKSKLRNTVSRMGRKFTADGGRLEILQDVDAIRAAIPAYQQVYEASWKIPEPFPEFVPSLIEAFAPKGWVRLGIGWVNDRPVAAQLWFVAHGRAEIYKVAYDEAFKHLSPGTLLTERMLHHVMVIDQVRETDYLIGDDPYKATWMSHRRERSGMVAYNPATFSGLTGLVRELVGRILKPHLRKLRAALVKTTGRPAESA